MSYDAASNETSIQDPDGNLSSFVYDSLNRRINTIDPQHLLMTYSYDQAGNLQTIIDRRGLKRQFVYDDASRRIDEQWFDANGVLTRTMTYTYNAASQLATAADPDSLYTYSYDNRGRLSSVNGQLSSSVTGQLVNGPNVVLNYGYDASGNRTSVTDNMGATISYVYDADNRLISEAMSVTGSSGTPQVSLGYDLAANLTSITRKTSSTSPSISSVIAYTNRNVVKQITHTSSQAGALGTFTYNYDPGLRITSAAEPALALLSYGYDSVNQLTSVSSGRNESYGYDLNGNRNTTGYQTSADNRLTNDGTYTYTYDNEGNLSTKSGNGQLTTYTWDNRQRLTRVQTSVSGTPTQDTRFTYDVSNRRIGKLVLNGTQQWSVYSGPNPYADFSGSGTTPTFRYLYGTAVDTLFARYDGTTTGWHLGDIVGSVRQIVDTSGGNQDTITYGNSFGNAPVDSQPSKADRFKFTGREFDAEISLYYYRARYYDSGTGRFVGQDPLRFAAKDPNLYRYAQNAPTSRVDPTGKFSGWACAGGAVTGGSIGTVIGGPVGGVLGAGLGCLAGGFFAHDNYTPSEQFSEGLLWGVPAGFVGGGLALCFQSSEVSPIENEITYY